MNILTKVTWKGMRRNKTRTVVTVVGIILSAAMFMAVTTLGYSAWDYMLRREIYSSGDYFLRFDYASKEYMESLSVDDSISKIGKLGILGYTTFYLGNSDESCAVAAGDQAFFDMVTVHLEEGRLPQNQDEIVITRNIYHYLKEAGRPCEIGQTVNLDIVPVYEEYEGEYSLPAEGTAFTKEYTIVGISEYFVRLNDKNLYLSHLFTFADDSDIPLWYRVYLKTDSPKASYNLALSKPENVKDEVNEAILALYGATGYSNVNAVILLICIVLAVIIMAGSVSLIYNAFSISVSERTKQFGLLTSVGATRSQIRRSVLSEAMLLSMVGIPIGVFFGYLGIAVTLNVLSVRINTLFSTGGGTILLEPKLSLIALAAAAMIAFTTVLISAAIPARRATRINPIEAIRQKHDYDVSKKTVCVSWLSYKLFGLPGILSRKYYKVSRKKYCATIVSIVISIVLFISAASVSQLIRESVDRNVETENYDMQCSGNREKLEQLREQPFIEDASYYVALSYTAFVPDAMLSDGFKDCWEAVQKRYDMLDRNFHDIQLIYLEDAVFKKYLSKHGLQEDVYFSHEIPTALSVGKEVTVYDYSEQTGQANRYVYAYSPYDAEGELLQLLNSDAPDGLLQSITDGPESWSYDFTTNEDGEPVFVAVPLKQIGEGMIGEDRENRNEYLIRWETGGDGKIKSSYYLRDTATGAVAEAPSAVENVDAPQVRIGATITELPFGVSTSAVSSYFYNYLILPMSSVPTELTENLDLFISVSDYTAAKAYLLSNFGKYGYHDYREGEENNRTLALLINVFAYGFIILISLISAANVFNTISTNATLRKRDFGMLKSTGFSGKDLRKMMNYECLNYGIKALLWGIPVSLVVSYLIQRIDRELGSGGFAVPWSALIIAIICVFTVVFAAMFYSITRLRGDNPIEAIRMENI